MADIGIGFGLSVDAIVFPPCPSCGAQEFGQRQMDAHPPEWYDEPLHALLNAIYEHCRERNAFHPHASEEAIALIKSRGRSASYRRLKALGSALEKGE